jgi:hypothetical protein
LAASKDDLAAIKSEDAQTQGKSAYREKCDPSFKFELNQDAREAAISLKDVRGSLNLLKVTYYSADQTKGTQIEGVWTQEGGHTEVLCHNTINSNSTKTGILAKILVPYQIDPRKNQMSTTEFALQGKQGSVAALRTDSKQSQSTQGFGTIHATKAGGAETLLAARQDGTVVWRFQGTRKNADGDLIYETVEAVYGSMDQADIVDPQILNQATTTAQAKANSAN